MFLSTVILPTARWRDATSAWRDADASGLHGAYTYDHLSWRSFRERPWFTMVPTLSAAAAVTSRIRLGPLVTSPNFRHPLVLAKDLIALDDISDGRVIVGVGSGGTGYDATVLGGEQWSVRERHQRFDEFTRTLDTLLRQPQSTIDGTFYSVQDSRQLPGPVQQPRPPLYLSALGPKSLALTAEIADGWVSIGSPDPAVSTYDAVRAQLIRVREELDLRRRAPASLHTVLLNFGGREQPLASYEAFVDWAGRYHECGFDEVVVHWPTPESAFDADRSVFDQVLSQGAQELATWR